MPSFRSVALVPVLGLGLALSGCGDKDGPETQQTQAQPSDVLIGPEVGDVIAQADAFIAARKITKQYGDWRLRLPRPQRFTFPTDKKVLWRLETNKGTMVAELLPNAAPLHISSVVYLTRLGFYDGLAFHRVIRGFMAQGGDPRGDGSGWPGYSMPTEITRDLRHDQRGVLSTANASKPNTDGSQFFIMFRARPELDFQYTIFGKVIEGLDVLDRFEAVAAPSDPGRPSERLVIEKATIELR
jgi:cyclophilin family peptidyl-prolyl cis-trans isomerase